MSATFSPDVEALKELVLHNPVSGHLGGHGERFRVSGGGGGTRGDLGGAEWAQRWGDSGTWDCSTHRGIFWGTYGVRQTLGRTSGWRGVGPRQPRAHVPPTLLRWVQVTVRPPEPQLPSSSQLRQFVVRCDTEEDKFLLLCALLKLRLLRGRALLFVGTLARCYRLKLFLEQFGIPACALNSELPARSR